MGTVEASLPTSKPMVAGPECELQRWQEEGSVHAGSCSCPCFYAHQAVKGAAVTPQQWTECSQAGVAWYMRGHSKFPSCGVLRTSRLCASFPSQQWMCEVGRPGACHFWAWPIEFIFLICAFLGTGIINNF